MNTIDFDIEKAKSGNYKIVTKDGRPARILCWDKIDGGDYCIVALIKNKVGNEVTMTYREDGLSNDHFIDDSIDLQLQVEDGDKLTWEDLTEFEYAVAKALYDEYFIKTNNQGILRYIKQLANELYDAAKKQFIQEQAFKEINDEVKQHEFVYKNGKLDIEKKEPTQPTFDGMCLDITKPNNKRYVEEHTFKLSESTEEEIVKKYISENVILGTVLKVLKDCGWCVIKQDEVTDIYDLAKSITERMQRISNTRL